MHAKIEGIVHREDLDPEKPLPAEGDVLDLFFVQMQGGAARLSLRLGGSGAAVEQSIKYFASDVEVYSHVHKVSSATLLAGADIIITALDSINARKEAWKAKKSPVTRYWLDSRMSSQQFQLFTVNMDNDTAWYQKFMDDVNEEDVPDDPCTAKAIIFTAMFAAGHIAQQVMRIVRGDDAPMMVYHNIETYYLNAEGTA
jgi:hypothetical protein